MTNPTVPLYFGPLPTPERPLSNGWGVAALVVGIIVLAASVVPVLSYLAVLAAPVAIVFGVVGVTRSGRPRANATAGLVLGGIALMLGVVLSIVYTSVFGWADAAARSDGGPDAAAPPAATPAPVAPTASPTPIETGPPVVTFAGDGVGDSGQQELAGDYEVAWRTLGDCYYFATLDDEFFDEVFSASSATSGTNFIYDVSPGPHYVAVSTGPAPNCAWEAVFTPTG